MASRWRSDAKSIADETFLSVREAETVLAYDELAHPTGVIPPPKQTVFDTIGDELGVEATTVRTYLDRAEQKLGRGVATALAVDDPGAFADGETEVDGEPTSWLKAHNGPSPRRWADNRADSR